MDVKSEWGDILHNLATQIRRPLLKTPSFLTSTVTSTVSPLYVHWGNLSFCSRIIQVTIYVEDACCRARNHPSDDMYPCWDAHIAEAQGNGVGLDAGLGGRETHACSRAHALKLRTTQSLCDLPNHGLRRASPANRRRERDEMPPR